MLSLYTVYIIIVLLFYLSVFVIIIIIIIIITIIIIIIVSPARLWNTMLVSSRASLTSWGEGASLVLVGRHPSSSGVTIKMPYVVARCFTLTSFAPHLVLLGWLRLNLALL